MGKRQSYAIFKIATRKKKKDIRKLEKRKNALKVATAYDESYLNK